MCVNFLDVSSFDAFHLASSCFHGHRKLLFHSDCCSTTLPDVSFCNESTIKKQIIRRHHYPLIIVLGCAVVYCISASKLKGFCVCGPLCLTAVHHNSNSRGIGDMFGQDSGAIERIHKAFFHLLTRSLS